MLFFHTIDRGPPHFHAVKHGHWHYRVRFLEAPSRMLEAKSGPGSLRGTERRDLLRMAARHRWELLREQEASRSG